MKKIIFVLCCLLCLPVYAEDVCWVFSDLNGTAHSQSDLFKPMDDGFGNSMFFFFIKENNEVIGVQKKELKNGTVSTIILNESLVYFSPSKSKNAIIGVYYREEDKIQTIETWNVDEKIGKVFMTKTISGFPLFNTSTAMVGDAVKCDP